MELDQFTLDEANALVPWLQEKFRGLDNSRQEYVALQERFSELAHNSENDDAMAKSAERARTLADQIEDVVQEILDQGIIVRDAASGLVDFPSQRDGREVFLCWIGGEERIDYWHETDRGFDHREPL